MQVYTCFEVEQFLKLLLPCGKEDNLTSCGVCASNLQDDFAAHIPWLHTRTPLLVQVRCVNSLPHRFPTAGLMCSST